MNNPQAKNRLWIALPLVICWLAGTSYAFWWFEARDLRSFDTASEGESVLFEGERLAEKLHVLPLTPDQTENSQALVVHFWNPDCGCNKFNNPHVRDIVEQYSKQGIRFLTVVRTQPDQDQQALLTQAETLFNIPAILESSLQMDSSSAPSATPAAAVINNQGQLAYFGPYSDGAFCGANGGSFVEKTLNRVLEGKITESSKTLAFGCFCQWKQDVSTQII